MAEARPRRARRGGSETGGWTDFASAAEAAVNHLLLNAPLDLWLLTHVIGADQVVVASAGAWSVDFPAGTTRPWLESFCLQMAAGQAPATAPRVHEVPQFAAATARWGAQVKGYTGVPLMDGAGELFGSLAGFSAQVDDPRITGSAGELRLLGRMLSTLLTSEVSAAELREQLETLQELSETDHLTGLRNRRGWVAGLAREDRRNARYGAAAGVIAIDLDDLKSVNDTKGHHAGDALLCKTARVLTLVCRPSDVLARPGGDEFAVLAVEASAAAVASLTERLRESLEAAGVLASLAGAVQDPGEDLAETWARADRAMYAEKDRRRSASAEGGADFAATREGAAERRSR